MDFSKIDEHDYVPVYVQIKRVIQENIESRVLSKGDTVPSVREIARDAGVNPNTAAKALRDLVLEGILVSRQGVGYAVAGADPGAKIAPNVVPPLSTPSRPAVTDLSQSKPNSPMHKEHSAENHGALLSSNYVPEYVKIQNAILEQVASNRLRPGDAIPSIKAMADQRGLNENTVAKAYRELQLRGVVVSRRGVGFTIVEDAASTADDDIPAPSETDQDCHIPSETETFDVNSIGLGPIIHSYVPEYVKVQNEILEQVASNRLRPGDAIPSIKAMADQRGLNENTVAKAYRELQLRGVIVSRRGVGFTIVGDSPGNTNDHEISLVSEIADDSLSQVETDVPDSKSIASVSSNFEATSDPASQTNLAPDVSKVKVLLNQGENERTEFKSSLRHDIRATLETGEIVNSVRLEHSVLKTIAAFLNSRGGDLLIGVSDDAQVIGIEHDGFQNQDKFLLHLYNLIKQRLGNTVAAQVRATCVTLDGRQICLVACERSPYPVFLNDKQGQEEFYVRMGPSSSGLRPSEIHQYITHNFAI